jgi:hypothetical protein
VQHGSSILLREGGALDFSGTFTPTSTSNIGDAFKATGDAVPKDGEKGGSDKTNVDGGSGLDDGGESNDGAGTEDDEPSTAQESKSGIVVYILVPMVLIAIVVGGIMYMRKMINAVEAHTRRPPARHNPMFAGSNGDPQQADPEAFYTEPDPNQPAVYAGTRGTVDGGDDALSDPYDFPTLKVVDPQQADPEALYTEPDPNQPAVYDGTRENGQAQYDVAGNAGAVYDEAAQSSATTYALATGDDDLEL